MKDDDKNKSDIKLSSVDAAFRLSHPWDFTFLFLFSIVKPVKLISLFCCSMNFFELEPYLNMIFGSPFRFLHFHMIHGVRFDLISRICPLESGYLYNKDFFGYYITVSVDRTSFFKF